MREPPVRPGWDTHRCRADRVTSRNDCSSATAALLTSSSNGPAAPTAASTASQSAKSRQRVSMPGHCGEGGRRGREAAREPGGPVRGYWGGGGGQEEGMRYLPREGLQVRRRSAQRGHAGPGPAQRHGHGATDPCGETASDSPRPDPRPQPSARGHLCRPQSPGPAVRGS